MANVKPIYIDGIGQMDLTPGDQIGAGGMGVVFKSPPGTTSPPIAIKLWKKMTPDIQRKITYLTSGKSKWPVPSKVYLLQQTVRENKNGPIIGATMKLLDNTAREFGILLNRKIRAMENVDDQLLAQIFAASYVDFEAISKYLVVVDINPRNLVFFPGTTQVGWLDTDTWMIPSKDFNDPLIYTQGFLDPLLMVGSKVKPLPANAGYSLAVLFWQAALGVHPFGGTHPKLLNLNDRLKERAWVLDPKVKVPSIAYSPEIFSDDLLSAFEATFVKDEREIITADLVKEHVQSMTKCPSCNQWYSGTRVHCPHCSMKTAIPHVIPSALQAKVLRLLDLQHQILFAAYDTANKTLVAIAKEDELMVTYRRGSSGSAERVVLFPFERGLRFELMSAQYLAVNRGSSRTIEVWHLQTPRAQLITETSSEPFAANYNRVAFRGSNGNLIRLVRNYMNRASFEIPSQLVDRVLPAAVSPGRTWFWSDPNANRHLIFMSIFDQDSYVLVNDNLRVELPSAISTAAYADDGTHTSETIKQLFGDERVVDMRVVFGKKSLLIRRLTQQGSREYLRTELVKFEPGTTRAQVIHSSRIAKTDHDNPEIRGVAFSDERDTRTKQREYLVWSATDNGLLRENLLTGKFSPLPKTAGAVSVSDSLIHLGSATHFLVIGPTNVTYLTIS